MDGEIITCTDHSAAGDDRFINTCDAEGQCSSSNCDFLGPASTLPESTASQDNDAIENVGCILLN